MLFLLGKIDIEQYVGIYFTIHACEQSRRAIDFFNSLLNEFGNIFFYQINFVYQYQIGINQLTERNFGILQVGIKIPGVNQGNDTVKMNYITLFIISGWRRKQVKDRTTRMSQARYNQCHLNPELPEIWLSTGRPAYCSRYNHLQVR